MMPSGTESVPTSSMRMSSGLMASPTPMSRTETGIVVFGVSAAGVLRVRMYPNSSTPQTTVNRSEMINAFLLILPILNVLPRYPGDGPRHSM